MRVKKKYGKVPVIICGPGACIGDDIMFFWAAVAGVLLDILPQGVRIFFSRPTSRHFLSLIAKHYFAGYVEILTEDPSKEGGCIHTRSLVGRPDNGCFQMNIKGALKKTFWGAKNPTIYCNGYIHKFFSEFGNDFKLTWKERFSKVIHLWKVWSPPYPNIYDGWQEVAVAYGFKKKDALIMASRLPRVWPKIRELLRVDEIDLEDSVDRYPVLLFPSGGGSQDFDEVLMDSIRSVFPALFVARFTGDLRFSNLRYDSLDEAMMLMRKSAVVITNDSMASHLAQFFSSNHILICSRSRPGNVCFPGAGKSFVIDLGIALPCRPCAYVSIDSERLCAAGHKRCIAFAQKEYLKERLKFFRSSASKNLK